MADLFWESTLGEKGSHDSGLGKKVSVRTADSPETKELGKWDATFSGEWMI